AYFSLLKVHRPSISKLFPYTTLFRSVNAVLMQLRKKNLPLVPIDDTMEGDEEGTMRKEPGAPDERLARPAPCASCLLRRLPWCRSEEHTSELQSRENLVCRLLLEKKK